MAVRVPYTPGQIADFAVGRPVAGIALLVFLLVMLDWLRSGRDWTRFTRERITAYFLTAFGFMLLATVAPGVAWAIVFGLVILTALGMASPIADIIERTASRIGTSPAATRPGPT